MHLKWPTFLKTSSLDSVTLPFVLWSHSLSRNKVRNKGRRRLPIQAVPEGTGVPVHGDVGPVEDDARTAL